MATSKIEKSGNTIRYTLTKAGSTEADFIKAVINDAIGRGTANSSIIVDAVWEGYNYYTFLVRCLWSTSAIYLCYKSNSLYVGIYKTTDDSLEIHRATLS